MGKQSVFLSYLNTNVRFPFTCHMDSKLVYPEVPIIHSLVGHRFSINCHMDYIDQLWICCDEKCHSVALPQNREATFTYTQSLFPNITTNNFNMQTFTGKTNIYTPINTEYTSSCTLSFGLVGFQLENFGKGCFGTRINQICFFINSEKFPVTASNCWEPMDWNEALISLPPKKKQKGGKKTDKLAFKVAMCYFLKFKTVYETYENLFELFIQLKSN